MNRLRVPVDNRRADWPRLVADAIRNTQNDIVDLRARFVVRSVTATTTATAAEYLILANATSGAITVNLPAVAASEGALLVVKKTDASGNAVTLDGNASETIDGATTQAITTQYDAITVACDGTAWWIV